MVSEEEDEFSTTEINEGLEINEGGEINETNEEEIEGITHFYEVISSLYF